MTCDFTSFSTVFDVGMLMMKDCVQIGASFTAEKISPRAGIELGQLDQ